MLLALPPSEWSDMKKRAIPADERLAFTADAMKLLAEFAGAESRESQLAAQTGLLLLVTRSMLETMPYEMGGRLTRLVGQVTRTIDEIEHGRGELEIDQSRRRQED